MVGYTGLNISRFESVGSGLHDFAFGVYACFTLSLVLILHRALFNYQRFQMLAKYSVFQMKSRNT